MSGTLFFCRVNSLKFMYPHISPSELKSVYSEVILFTLSLNVIVNVLLISAICESVYAFCSLNKFFTAFLQSAA